MRRVATVLPALALTVTFMVTAACSSAPSLVASGEVIETTSLLGRPLAGPELPESFRAEQLRLLVEAEAELAARPEDPDAWIWVGRRQGYLGRYRDAVATFSRGIERFPEDARFRRHRGHRYITLRRFEDAVADLERGIVLAGASDRVEPDGLPNERGQPTGTLRSNLGYHLGLARYLLGDLHDAEAAYRYALAAVDNPDNRVAASYWLYLILRRLDRPRAAAAVLAPISAELDVIENHDYHRLLLAYRGERDPDALLEGLEPGSLAFATVGYGVGAWRLLEGRAAVAEALWRDIVDAGNWSAFGAIAAEAELARLAATAGGS